MDATQLVYFDSPYLYEAPARVVAVAPYEGERTDVILDGTIFYPQGGGQPYDNGTITAASGTLTVHEVRFKDGVVHHIGTLEGTLKDSAEVTCTVDVPRRQFNSRYHSGGHLIDIALENLGYLWEPHKGHHYPNEAYDEFLATISQEEAAELLPKLQTEVDRLIAGGAAVTMKIMSREDLEKLCRFVPAQLPVGKPTRGAIMHIENRDRGIPCGGTHVANISELAGMKIRKIKEKQGVVKVSYGW